MRNRGVAPLPAGVVVGVYKVDGDVQLGTVITNQALLAGQNQVLLFEVPEGMADGNDELVGRVLVDPTMPLFHECREDSSVAQFTLCQSVAVYAVVAPRLLGPSA